MNVRLLFISFFIWNLSGFSQEAFLEGTWQGVLMTQGQKPRDGKAIWIEFGIDGSGKVKGESRVETPFTDYYAYKSIKGDLVDSKQVTYKDIFIGSQQNTGSNVWCMYQAELSYDDSTGYLSGKWSSTDCKRQMGEMILYRSEYEMSKSDTLSLYHSWFNNLATDLERGWNAYYVREAEMRNFKFVPVYFDHDKDDLKPKFNAYLKRMADIVNSHSDLRIKIIGHTDSNGSDAYNVDLSKRRAARIESYLKSVGVPSDRIVIEFRGEKDPATSNKTSDGKRLNRRVDFEFI